AGTASLPAQVSVTSGTFTYTQNFNTLPVGGGSFANNYSVTWTDNTNPTMTSASGSAVGLPGWYAEIGSAVLTSTQMGATDGSSSTAHIWDVGALGSTNRALGILPGSAATPGYIALCLTNNSGTTINNVTVSFTGEEWRSTINSAGSTRTLSFAYQQGTLATPYLNQGTWTSVSALNFVSPNTAALPSPAYFDGTLPGNSTYLTSSISVAGGWAPGAELWLRWSDPNVTGGAALLAIDNLTVSAVSAVPEPSTYAALAGLAALGLVIRRRRQTPA
ncbi:MAG: PEP-CTERM sorting domain-containing protein, partial [Opitutales bacterium]